MPFEQHSPGNFDYKSPVNPQAEAQLAQEKAKAENAQKAKSQDNAYTAIQDAVKTASDTVTQMVQRSKENQRQSFVKTLADSLANSGAIKASSTPVSLFANSAPGEIGPRNQTSMTVPTASFSPDSNDAIRSAVMANPEKATEDYLKKSLLGDPEGDLLKKQGKMLDVQLKQHNLGPVSDTVKTMLKSAGVDVPEDMSNVDLKEALPGMGAGLRASVLGEMAKARGDAVTTHMAEAMGKDLDEKQWTSGPGKTSADRVNFATNAKSLFEQVRSQPDGADRRQMLEGAMETTRTLIGNGVLSEKIVHDLIPSTAIGKGQTWHEWFSNKPEGLQQQKFFDRLEATIDRVAVVNQKVVDESKMKRLAKYGVLKGRDADLYGSILEASGFDPENVKKGIWNPTAEIKPPEYTPNKGGGLNIDMSALDAELAKRGH